MSRQFFSCHGRSLKCSSATNFIAQWSLSVPPDVKIISCDLTSKKSAKQSTQKKFLDCTPKSFFCYADFVFGQRSFSASNETENFLRQLNWLELRNIFVNIFDAPSISIVTWSIFRPRTRNPRCNKSLPTEFPVTHRTKNFSVRHNRADDNSAQSYPKPASVDGIEDF